MPFSQSSPSKINTAVASVYDDDQILGQIVGQIDVGCKFKAEELRWTINDNLSHVTTLLFFQFDFQSNIPFEWVQLGIDVGNGSNPPTTLKACHPDPGIEGPPRDASIHEGHELSPEGELGSGGLTGKFKIGSRWRSVERNRRRRWCFTARTPSGVSNRVEKADFMLEPDGDQRSMKKPYFGALVVKHPDGRHQSNTTPNESASDQTNNQLILKVHVEVRPCHWWRQLQRSASQPKQSNPFSYPEAKKLQSDEFESRERGLQIEIARRNGGSALIGKCTTIWSHYT
jgi:hypothetical protein